MRCKLLCVTFQLSLILSIATFVREIDTSAVKVMKETWNEHNESVTRVYLDDYVAIYYDKDVNQNRSITWPFEIISKAWKYVKETYGPFGPDPLLYVILHETKYEEGCFTSWNLESNPGSRNQIDCAEGRIIKATPTNSRNLANILYFLGEVIVDRGDMTLTQRYATNGGQGMMDIICYDLTLFLKDPLKDAVIWKNLKSKEVQNGIFWFRDWFLPIYEQFGGTSTFRNFLNLTNGHWSNKTEGTLQKTLNLAELVHVWSGAAQQDLYSLAKLAINNSTEFYNKVMEARKNYSFINYTITKEPKVIKETWHGHDEVLTLVHLDDHAAVYYDKEVNQNGNITWPFEFLSKAWKYVQQTYGPFGPDPLLYIIIHATKHNRGCFLDLNLKSKPGMRNQLDCAEGGVIKAIPRNSGILDNVIHFMAMIVAHRKNMKLVQIENTIGQRGNMDILWYDLTLFLKDPTESLVFWRELKLKELEKGNFWFWNWFLPIYEQFGGNSALKNFFNLTNGLWLDKTGDISKETLNRGEFVHFWSGATQSDLYPIAKLTFQNSSDFFGELVAARKNFPTVIYTRKHCDVEQGVIRCDKSEGATCKNIAWQCNGKNECSDGSDEANCTECKSNAFKCARGGCVERKAVCNFKSDCPLDDSDESSCTDVWNPKSWKTTWKEPYTELERVYLDDDISVYCESGMNLSLVRISGVYSQAWAHVKETYGTFGKNSRLGVVLRSDDWTPKDCATHFFSDTGFAPQNVISCGKMGWALKNFSNFLDVVSAIVKIVRDKAKGTQFPQRIDIEVSANSMESIIFYDLLVKLKGQSDTGVQIWKKRELSRTWNGLYFFRDWFLPIYENHASFTALGNFYRVAKSEWAKGLKKTTRQYFNAGEFVHFWSGAAGADLLPIALQIFNDSSSFYPQLVEAKKNFPAINYTATPCKDKQFRCEEDHVCIPQKWQCNRIQECSDESDEANCTETGQEVSTIVGIFVFVFLVASVVVGVLIVSYRTKIRKLQQVRGLTNAEVSEFLDGNINLNKHNANCSIYSRPFISDYETPQENLVIDDARVLGSGEFGIVKEGKLLRDQHGSRSAVLIVAVKMVKPNAKVEHFKAFLKEIKIMAYLGQHQNITSLLGTVTSNIQKCEVFVALEYCSNGDLLHFLRANCNEFQDLFRPNVKINTSVVFTSGVGNNMNSDVTFVKSSVPTKVTNSSSATKNSSISTLDLLEWSREIADGMNYLTFKKVIHGDLAARNVLLTGNKTAKITDFGLSHQLINYEIYRKSSKSPLPWRWLALESLSSRTFSVHSDVWAFGVTFWEIFTLGQVPFPERKWDHRYINDLANGMRPNSPRFGNMQIYNLMMNCMKMVPSERMPFAKISLELQEITQSLIPETNLPCTSGRGQTCNYSVL